jgi:hypothetical protein
VRNLADPGTTDCYHADRTLTIEQGPLASTGVYRRKNPTMHTEAALPKRRVSHPRSPAWGTKFKSIERKQMSSESRSYLIKLENRFAVHRAHHGFPVRKTGGWRKHLGAAKSPIWSVLIEISGRRPFLSFCHSLGTSRSGSTADATTFIGFEQQRLIKIQRSRSEPIRRSA